MKIVGYLRVSTEMQVESGLGLDVQRKSIEDYALKQSLPLECIYKDEGISGAVSMEKRPGILSAISSVGKKDILVVHKRDRLGRDPSLVRMIECAVRKRGGRIVSLVEDGTNTDDPSSILMKHIVDAFSEYERLIIKARIKSAMAVKKGRLERVGHIPYGYQLAEDGLHLEMHAEEQALLHTMLSLQEKGYSLRKIASYLNTKKLFNRNDSIWHHASVHRVMKDKSPSPFFHSHKIVI